VELGQGRDEGKAPVPKALKTGVLSVLAHGVDQTLADLVSNAAKGRSPLLVRARGVRRVVE
jgi:hypothetical protein